MKLINEFAKGYLYYVSLKGVTGSDDLDQDSVQKLYQQRKMQTNLPLMIGFGIKTAAMAATMATFADGVIVGAALIGSIIEAFKSGKDCNRVGASLIHDMRRAIDNG
jgi:tryptophan synthase alpha chain